MKAKYVTLGCAALVVLVTVPLLIRMSRRTAGGQGAEALRPGTTTSAAVYPEPLVPDYPRELLSVKAPIRRASWRSWHEAWWRDIEPVGNPS